MKLKRILAMVLCVCMVLSSISFTTIAETTQVVDVPVVDVWDGKVDTSWYDAANPQTEYTITTAEQFAGLAYLVNGAQTYSPAMGNNMTADFGYYCGENCDVPKIAAPAANANSVDFDGVTIKLAADLDMRAVYENGDLVLLPGNEYLTMMPIGYSTYTPFKGTFDGQGHTIKNIFQGMWDALGHPSDSYDQDVALGVFGNVEDATIKNLVVDNISFNAETTLGGVAGKSRGTSVFDNITVKNSIVATSGGWRVGGLIGHVYGDLTVKNINIDKTVTVAQTGGNYDTAAGGIIGRRDDTCTRIAFDNCKVACKLDVFNDIVANYKTGVYRNCGMIIGAIGEDHEITIDGKLYSDFDAMGLTFNNIDVKFGEWANYTYCWSDEVTIGCQRIEPGVNYRGVDLSKINNYAVDRRIFDALFGAENADSLENIRQRVDIDVAIERGITGIEAEEYQLLSGNGTEADPYLINNLKDLKNFRDDVNVIGNTYKDKYVKLTADIDLTGEVWTPIGTSVYSKEPTDSDIKMFVGNFDGGNHTITGLTSVGYVPDAAETEDNEYSFGLFGCVYGSNISNVKLANVDINCTTRQNSKGANVDGSGVAALVGYYIPVDGKTSVIENCHVLSGTVKASNNMGGLIGFIDSNFRMPEVDITIKDCSNAATVITDAREAGGIVGLVRSSRTDINHISMRGNILFENCVNSGDITSLGGGNPSAGGILGRDGNEDSWAKLNMVFDGCKNTGKITVYANLETHAAGIAAGYWSNGAWFIIKNSSNSGEVVVVNPENAEAVYAGGLISYGGVVELLNSLSTQAVKLGANKGNTYIGNVANILFLDGIYGYTDTVNGCTYFLNGGNAPDERKYLTDDSGNYNFYPVETATKDGFEFGYWYDNAELTGNVYDATTNIRNGSVNTFYAKWIGTVAKIGDAEYDSLEKAFAAANDGETITLMADATPILKSQRAITKAATIDLNGNKLTLTEDDLYFGTTTFKNGEIVVAHTVRPSTAVFWMFANQTLTFDNVKLTATGVTGTYLIGLEGNNSNLNLLNGSEIIVDNDTALDLDIICVNSSGVNNIVVDNSKVSVKNLDGRVFFNGNYTISGDSDIYLEGITKAGFRINVGQTLNVTDTATVNIVGEPRDGGIHITGLPATYTKADTAVVNATVNAPVGDAKIEDTVYPTLQDAVDAASDGDTIVLSKDEVNFKKLVIGKNITIDLNGKTIDYEENFSTFALRASLADVIDITSDVTFTNGTFDLTGATGTNGIFFINEGGSITLENIELVGSNLGDVNVFKALYNTSKPVITFKNVKANLTNVGGKYFIQSILNTGNETVYPEVKIEDSEINITNGKGTFNSINVDIDNTKINVTNMAEHVFRRVQGTVNNTAIKADSLEYFIKNVDGEALNFTGKTIVEENTVQGILLENGSDIEVTGFRFSFDPTTYVPATHKVVEGIGRYYVVPKYTVSAVVNDADKTVTAGETFTVSVVVTGDAFTNAGWSLKFDSSVVDYVSGAAVTPTGMIISEEIQGAGGTADEFYDGYVVKTYTFQAKTDIYAEKTAVFEIVNGDDADEITYVDNYTMAGELNIVEADKANDSVTIKLMTDKPGTLDALTVIYDGTEHRGNAVVGVNPDYVVYRDNAGNITKLPPVFQNVGEYNYTAVVTIPGKVAYEIALDSAEVTITKRAVTPTVEFNVDPDVNKVEFKPVIVGVVDGTFTGTVTVTANGDTWTFNAADFTYDGNGNAIYNGTTPIAITGLATAGNLTANVTYTTGANDNYATSTSSKTVNVDKITDEDVKATLRAAVTTEFEYNGTVRNATVGTLPAGWTYAITGAGITNVGKTVQTITFTDTNGKYNEYTYYVTLEVTPRKVTISVNDDINKKLGQTDEEINLANQYTVTHGHCTETALVNASDLGTIKVVRLVEGEKYGTEYPLTIDYTPNRNYQVTVSGGKLKISVPDYKVEVVDNRFSGIEDATPDYTVGKADSDDAQRLILVYTNADAAYFTCEGNKMYDVTERGYMYVDHDYEGNSHVEDTTKYTHVYAYVVTADMAYEATEAVERHYALKVSFAGSSESYKPEKVKYDANINQNPYVEDKLDMNDYTMVNGIYNAQDALYDIELYQLAVLKADADGNKLVDTNDAAWVKGQIK